MDALTKTEVIIVGAGPTGLALACQFRIKAGARFPYFLIDGTSVYDRLRGPRFHLVSFTDGERRSRRSSGSARAGTLR